MSSFSRFWAENDQNWPKLTKNRWNSQLWVTDLGKRGLNRLIRIRKAVKKHCLKIVLEGEKNLSGSSNHPNEYTYFPHYPHFPLYPKISTFLRTLIELKF